MVSQFLLCVKHMECEICVTDSSMCLSFSFRLQWLRGQHKSRWDGKARRIFFRFLVSSHTHLHAHLLSLSCADSCVKSLSLALVFFSMRVFIYLLRMKVLLAWARMEQEDEDTRCTPCTRTAVTTCSDENPLIRKNFCSQGGGNEG